MAAITLYTLPFSDTLIENRAPARRTVASTRAAYG
jgi:hypothetical protein